MLWYKSWLETRWRFLIGLVLLIGAATEIVLVYPKVLKLIPLVPAVDVGGELGRRIREGAQLASDYRGYIWSQAFRDSLANLVALFATLLGTGCLPGDTRGCSGLFTLSLPASRTRLLGVRASTGLAQLSILAVVPALLITLLSPAIGEHYGVGAALVHGACLFAAGAALFSLALLLSTEFGDPWRPFLITLFAAMVLSFCERAFGLTRYGFSGTMSGEVYFRTGALPWGGLLLSAAVSATLLYGAVVNFARRDF